MKENPVTPQRRSLINGPAFAIIATACVVFGYLIFLHSMKNRRSGRSSDSETDADRVASANERDAFAPLRLEHHFGLGWIIAKPETAHDVIIYYCESDDVRIISKEVIAAANFKGSSPLSRAVVKVNATVHGNESLTNMFWTEFTFKPETVACVALTRYQLRAMSDLLLKDVIRGTKTAREAFGEPKERSPHLISLPSYRSQPR